MQVTIQDKEFKEVKTLKTKEEIESFLFYWKQKKLLSSKLENPSWDYKVDIQTSKSSQRWLYNLNNGYCRILTKTKAPVYEIINKEEFNTLLLDH